jgi:hypothetical protein
MLRAAASLRRAGLRAATPHRAAAVSRALSTSVIEEAVARREDRTAAKVPVGPGETLLYTAGAGTKRTITLSWAASLTASGYFVAVKAAELWNPALQLLNATWTAVFGAVGVLTVGLAVSTSRCCVRAAVLCADGAHVRVYPYGVFMGVGMGAPVTVPIKLLRENSSFKAAKKDSDAMYVQVKESKAHLIWDKPTGVPLPKGPGSGLTWTAKGVEVPATSAPAATSAVTPTGGLYLMTPADRAAFRRYALLAHILNGNTVHMPSVLSDSWELERMKEQLDPARQLNPRQLRQEELRYWKSAVDKKTGQEYWYHELTWNRQWLPPTIDGKSPRDEIA